ncbi:MAG: hypothetical protein H7Y59_02545 [Anaerolineales bacterium]|nr:hypothetical protein [Anaerolineales bacterium]
MDHSEWLEQYLEKVAQSSVEGCEAVEYVRLNKTKIGIKRARKSVGAYWTINRKFYLNSVHHTKESTLQNPRAWTLFVHEVRHLQQGPITALSIYGELDAWQYEFRLYQKITGKELHPILQELLALPVNFDRENLSCARKLMIRYAGKGYRADILPLYPITKEIHYWLTRKQD